MFHLIKNWKLLCSGNREMQAEESICIEKEFTQEEMQAIQQGAFISETGDIEITPEIETKIELADIEERLKGSKERYAELKEMWEMRSNAEEIEFQTLETGKNTLLARRKQILDSFD